VITWKEVILIIVINTTTTNNNIRDNVIGVVMMTEYIY